VDDPGGRSSYVAGATRRFNARWLIKSRISDPSSVCGLFNLPIEIISGKMVEELFFLISIEKLGFTNIQVMIGVRDLLQVKRDILFRQPRLRG